MIFKSLKKLLLVISIFTVCNCTAIAQDFYKDYKSYLTSGKIHTSIQRKEIIDSDIARMILTTNDYEKENKHSFFTADTVFMVGFIGPVSSFSKITWTASTSCYYDYKWQAEHTGTGNRKLIIKTNASDILKSFDHVFRKAIESGDTLAYLKYAYKHSVLDGDYVSPVRAIKDGNHWKFTSFKDYGLAIDYTNTLNKDPVFTNINTIINNLSKEHFGFNIDSANAAYLSDTSKFKKQPQYPVVLFNGKVISYGQHESIELYHIKAISIWQKNSHDPAIPNGINSEFGIIAIVTDEKPN